MHLRLSQVVTLLKFYIEFRWYRAYQGYQCHPTEYRDVATTLYGQQDLLHGYIPYFLKDFILHTSTHAITDDHDETPTTESIIVDIRTEEPVEQYKRLPS